MRVGYFQFDVQRGETEANVALIAQAVIEGPSADLIVLPELCTSGYLFGSQSALAPHAQSLDGEIVQRISGLAVATATTLVFGLAETDGEDIFNTSVVASPDGQIAAQRKRHLTRLEKPLFAPGSEPQLIPIGDVSLGVLSCFDAWFPERPRRLMNLGADVLCCPSNFGGVDSLDVFRVRALENRVFVIVANRIGAETLDGVTAQFRGDSRVIAPDGTVLLAAGDEQALGVVDINPADARVKKSVMSDDLTSEWSEYLC